ncbi:hypothetical protein ACC692_36870, partial [Rhizobium ruizarguesonis]
SERGAVTGGIPRDAEIERRPLGEQPYPDDNSIGNPQPSDDYASIDPDQQIPPADQPKAAPDEPVITLKNNSRISPLGVTSTISLWRRSRNCCAPAS